MSRIISNYLGTCFQMSSLQKSIFFHFGPKVCHFLPFRAFSTSFFLGGGGKSIDKKSKTFEIQNSKKSKNENDEPAKVEDAVERGDSSKRKRDDDDGEDHMEISMLIRRMIAGVDITEVYSPARAVSVAQRYLLDTGSSLGLTTVNAKWEPWDFTC